MKKLLQLLFMLLLLTPFASAQRISNHGTAPLSGERETLQLTPMQPGVMPQEILDLVDSHKGQSGYLTLKRVSSRRVDENTTQITYSTSYDYTSWGETYTRAWATTFTFSTASDSVTIEGLMDGMLQSTSNVITAPYKDGVITIPAVDAQVDESGSTIVGKFWNYYTCYLFGGDLDEDGTTVTMSDEVLLYVADDLSTIDNGGKAIGIYYISQGNKQTLAYSPVGLVWNRMVDGPANIISATELDFGSIIFPKETSQSFYIQAIGSDAVDYKITCDDRHFYVDDTVGQLASLDARTFTVTFDPNEVGEFKGDLTVVAGDSTYTVICKGIATDIQRDFSDLVTKGDPSRFTWQNDETYPWTITDGVANFGNAEVPECESCLTGVLDCPKATRITFDYNIRVEGQDTLFIRVDGHNIKAITTNSNQNQGTYSFMVSSGKHAITWVAKSGFYAPQFDDYMYISNVKLDDAEEYELLSPDGTVTDFAMSGTSNYNGTVMPQNATDTGTFSINVNLAEASAVSFDVKAGEAYPVTITVDGATDRTITADETYYYNFTDGGSHTIVTTLGGFDAAISEVYLNAGEYTKVTRNYLVVGKSYLNENGGLDVINGKSLCYTASVTTTSTGKVYLDSLVTNDVVTRPNSIFGRLKGNTITISTPTKAVDGTLYGLDDKSEQYLDYWGYYDSRYWLESGTLESLETYDLKKGWQDEFTITCNDDMSRLTANTGFGIWWTYSWCYHNGIIEFLQPGATFYETVSGKVQAIAEVDTLDFGSVFANLSSISKSVMVLNLGDSTDFEAYIEGANKGMFTVTPTTGGMSAQGSQLFTVTYTPTRTGDHTAKLVVVTEGNEVEVVLTGEAGEMPDYDSIVTEGGDYIRGWDTSSDYPWYVEDGIAYSGNKGIQSSTSSLSADFIVPEGYYARVSADVKGFPELYDMMYVTLDGEQVRSYCIVEGYGALIEYGQFGKVVDEGDHSLKIWFEKGANDMLPCDDQAQISNLRIRLYAKGSDVAMTQMPKYYFEQLVPWDLGDSIEVTLVNKGTNALKVNSVTASAPFTVGNIADVAAGETGTFTVYMNPCDVDTYCKTITLHTTAGDIDFDVQGTTDYVRYLGIHNTSGSAAPICTFYNKYYVSVSYTQSFYESDWLRGLEGAQFTDMTFFTEHIARLDMQSPSVKWNIMETTSTTTILDNDNPIPDGLVNVYEGEQIDIDRYELNVPFAEPYTYQGQNFIYFQQQLATEPYAYQFYFRSEMMTDEDGKADESNNITGVWVSVYDWVTTYLRPIMRIRYIPASDEPGSGVQELNVTDQMQGDGYTYDLMGRRVDPNNLTPGIYIKNGKKIAVK